MKAKDTETKLHRLVIGQEEAIHEIVRIHQTYLAGLSPEGRPIGSFLFLGPTGTAKTRAVEATAEALLGNPGAVIKIDCGEELLDQFPTNSLKLSFVLFHEIERASDALWNLLLGILDRATLTLGDNRKVDFSNALIFMTSNMDAAEISSLVGPKLVSRPGKPAARRKFTPEFINRLDKIVVFRSLKVLRETDTWETWKTNWVIAA
jgi:ATP-dependent Clp protease ATP-binding subunit ClpA